MRYLFDEWGKISERIKGRHLFIFLDFDGTVVSIARTPDKVVLSEEVRGLLKALACNPKVRLAFVSGRSVKDIKQRIGIESIVYSGNHGLEIEGPKIKFNPALPAGYRAVVESIKRELGRKISPIQGAFIEDKGLSLSLHYRQVNKERIPLLKTIFHETVIVYLVKNKIRVKPGKMVLELRPPVEWDKGKVVLWLLSRQMFADKKDDVLPVYLGDDLTDRDAFRALKGKGLTIAVGRSRKLGADYYVKDQREAAEFLKKVQGDL
jgi:trehalose-phosphatase